MKYRPTPLFWVFIGLCLFWGLVGYSCACEEVKEFGCEPFVNCWPVSGGWNWIGEKK